MGTVVINIDCQLNDILNYHGNKSLGISAGGLSRLIELRRLTLSGRYHATGRSLGSSVASCFKVPAARKDRSLRLPSQMSLSVFKLFGADRLYHATTQEPSSRTSHKTF